MRSHGKLKYLSVFCILSLMMSQHASASESKKRVLVLHAYHQGFHWTDRIMAGISSVFDGRDDVELFINYMDTKRQSGDAYFKLLRDLYATKYQFVTFDAIISSDDNALDFLLEYRDELFPNTPVIFSGLNAFSPNRLRGLSKFTGVYESYDAAGTIELMLELHPGTKSIAAITDETRSGIIFKNLINQAESKFTDQVKINYLHNLPPKALQQSLTQLPENSLVLWAIYLRTPFGTTLSSEESVRLVSETSRYPTYCVWDVVGQGVVGGKITSPNFQGESAAKIALRVLQGEAIEDIPVRGSPLVNIFDFEAMQRFDINQDKAPASSIILNKPDSFYQLYQRYIWIYSAILILLITTIAFLINIILLKRKRDKYEGMAMHDQLTGLYNRYFLQEMATQKLSEANRHQYPMSLLMLDLDNFKAINDTHGHPMGDVVLQEFAKLIEEHNRAEDIVARIGGEEFVILLDHCTSTEAEEKAQLVRNRVSELQPNGIPITVSIGIAELNTKGEAFSDLLERSDRAVYQAKENGRNNVVIL